MTTTKLGDIRALAATLPVRHIMGEDGTPYLSRYVLHGWAPDRQVDAPCSVYLHHIHRADLDDAMHSHPWAWAQTMVLHGGYSQQIGYLDQAGELLPVADWHIVPEAEILLDEGCSWEMAPGFIHRITGVLPDTWTLFTVGPKTSSWGFYVPGHGLVPWRERLAERGLVPDYPESGGGGA